jgi:hypothetical protein
VNMTRDRLYWVCICLLAFPIGCSKSHQVSTSVDAGVDAEDSQAGGGRGTRTNSDEESVGAGSNGGIGGTGLSSGNGGAGQGIGGSAGEVHYDRDDFEPYDELTILSIPRPVCPETPPIEGTACADPGPSTSVYHRCGYGTSLRADCRQVYYCKSDGTWGGIRSYVSLRL